MNEIKGKYNNWVLNIYGDYSHINSEKYDKSFFDFKGRYEHKHLEDILSNSCVLTIPSKCKETFGFIGLEAYSYGIPVIASENVGFSGLINNDKNGIVYKESPNNEYLKNALVEILKNPQALSSYNKELSKENFGFLIRDHCHDIINCYK